MFSGACEGRDRLLNELNMSSYIQTMQPGLMIYDKQEVAGVFLLSAINDQEYVAILKDATHLPPVLHLERLNKYSFSTSNDGGTGA